MYSNESAISIKKVKFGKEKTQDLLTYERWLIEAMLSFKQPASLQTIELKLL